MTRVGARAGRRGISLVLLLAVSLTVCPLVSRSAAAPLDWAELEGANLRLDPPQTGEPRDTDAFIGDARRRLVGAVFFHDANDELAVLYRFARVSAGEISVEDERMERDRQMTHLERFAVRDVAMGNRGANPLVAVYLIVQPDRHPESAVMVGGGLISVALVFTPRDMQKFSQWPGTIQSAIRERRIMSGMTRAQVVMSRGVPGRRDSIRGEPDVTERWCYPALHVLFSEGRVARTEEGRGRC